MRVLFDHVTPKGIAPALLGHTVTKARDQGWDTLTNGELLNAAERAGFDVLVTADKNMRYQQNLAGRIDLTQKVLKNLDRGETLWRMPTRHTSMPGRTRLILFAGFVCCPLSGDLTVRYQTDIRLDPALTPAKSIPLLRSIDAVKPRESWLRLKNGTSASSWGGTCAIYDFRRQEMTLIDEEARRRATVPVRQFAETMTRAMFEAPVVSGTQPVPLTSRFESKLTGRTAMIQGIEGEEREFVITADAAPAPDETAGPRLRVAMRVWTAKAGEASRITAIRELSRYDLFATDVTNPVAWAEKSFEQVPSLQGTFAALHRDIQASGTPFVLRFEMEVFTTRNGILTKTGSPAGFDAEKPFVRLREELIDISSTAVPDSVFQIPEGYAAVSAVDILKSMVRRAQGPLQIPPPHGVKARPSGSVMGGMVPRSSAAAPTPLIVGNVKAVPLLRSVPPVYPRLAVQARIQGTVRFTALISKDGTVKSLQLVSGHPLLIQAAQDAAKQWLYKPTLLNGVPVEVLTHIDVNFTLDSTENASRAANSRGTEQPRTEQRPASEPDELEYRKALLKYYYRSQYKVPQGSDPGLNRAVLTQIEWIIEHHPEIAGEGEISGAMDVLDVNDRERVFDLWKNVLADHAKDAEVMIASSSYYAHKDVPKAIELLKSARALGSLRAGQVLASILADVFWAASHPNQGDKEKASIAGPIQRELETSDDALVIGELGGLLVFVPDLRLNDEYIRFGEQLLQRAHALEPDNPKWTQALNELSGRKK